MKKLQGMIYFQVKKYTILYVSHLTWTEFKTSIWDLYCHFSYRHKCFIACPCSHHFTLKLLNFLPTCLCTFMQTGAIQVTINPHSWYGDSQSLFAAISFYPFCFLTAFTCVLTWLAVSHERIHFYSLRFDTSI